MNVFLCVYETMSGIIQISIESDDNLGYRLLGPKMDGSQRELTRHLLSERDLKELGRYVMKGLPENVLNEI